MARHCRTCGETLDDCICGDDEQDEDGWAGQGFTQPARCDD